MSKTKSMLRDWLPKLPRKMTTESHARLVLKAHWLRCAEAPQSTDSSSDSPCPTTFFRASVKMLFFGPRLPDDGPKKYWLSGWLAIWLAGWLSSWLAISDSLATLAGWLFGNWLCGCLAGYLAISYLAGWLIGRLALAIWLAF